MIGPHPWDHLGTSLTVSCRRIRPQVDMSLGRSLTTHQASPEKPTMTGSVVSALPRTKALCELKGQTQVPLSGRGLGKAQCQPGTSHLIAWASPKATASWGFLPPRAFQQLAAPHFLCELRPRTRLWDLRTWAQIPGAPSLSEPLCPSPNGGVDGDCTCPWGGRISSP